jgi:hypothetical protein
MKIEYTLKSVDRTILRILHEVGSTSYGALKQILAVLDSEDIALEKIINNLAASARRNTGLTICVGTIGSARSEHWIDAYLATLSHLELIKRADSEEQVKCAAGYVSAEQAEEAREHSRYYALTERGEEVAKRIEAGRRVIVRPTQSARDTLFIASAFGHHDTDSLFVKALNPACQALGYTPVRVDMNEPPGTITESIQSGIEGAEAVIADLTYARPSVYFEIGYAFGLGLHLLLTCRKDHLNSAEDALRIHFDLAQFKISLWEYDSINGAFIWPDGMDPLERLTQIIPKRRS